MIQRIKEEVIRAIPGIIFFLVAFNIITLTESLILPRGDIGYSTYLEASLGALLVGKLLILVNNLPFINAFPNRPLIYNILWKSAIYSIFSIIFRVVELFVHLYFVTRLTSLAWWYLQAKLMSPVFWGIQIWVVTLFVVYAIADELINAIGKRKVLGLLFGNKQMNS